MPLFSPQIHDSSFFAFTSFSILASLSLFIFKWTSKHSPLFFPRLIVPVTVRNPLLDAGFTNCAFSLVTSFSCLSVMFTPGPPIGSSLTLSVLSISMASSLALILICNFGGLGSVSGTLGRGLP